LKRTKISTTNVLRLTYREFLFILIFFPLFFKNNPRDLFGSLEIQFNETIKLLTNIFDLSHYSVKLPVRSSSTEFVSFINELFFSLKDLIGFLSDSIKTKYKSQGINISTPSKAENGVSNSSNNKTTNSASRDGDIILRASGSSKKSDQNTPINNGNSVAVEKFISSGSGELTKWRSAQVAAASNLSPSSKEAARLSSEITKEVGFFS
jgi:hypothetical protein